MNTVHTPQCSVGVDAYLCRESRRLKKSLNKVALQYLVAGITKQTESSTKPWLPINILAELGTKELENLHTLDLFLSQLEVGIMMPDDDVWIAATTKQLSYDLITSDTDFKVFEDIFGKKLHILLTT